MQLNSIGSSVLSTIHYCGNVQILDDVFRKDYFTDIKRKIYVTEYYPSNTFGGIEVQEKKFSCYNDFYKKHYTMKRKSSFNVNVLIVEIIPLVC